MEKGATSDRKSVISQLTQGIEFANKLNKQLRHSTNSREACGFLVEKIVSCYDNALELLNCRDFLENGDPSQLAAVSNILVSTALIAGSPRSEVSDQDSKDHIYTDDVHKKRKTLPRRSEQVRVCSGTGSEGQLDDGYNWRKYGQKDILRASHPRAYYRCTHRYTQGCLATKQVQQMEDDSSIFKVVYRGKHSCIQDGLKQTKENVDAQMKDEENQRLSQQMMISIEPGLKAEPRELNTDQEPNFHPFSFLSTPIESGNVETQFFSEPTSESYFSMSHSHLNDINIDHTFLTSESYFTEIISDPTSAANFPAGDLDFLIDQVDFDADFLDAAEYFSHIPDSSQSKI